MAARPTPTCRFLSKFVHRRVSRTHPDAPTHSGSEGGSISPIDGVDLHIGKVCRLFSKIHGTVLTRDSAPAPGTAGTQIAPIDVDELE